MSFLLIHVTDDVKVCRVCLAINVKMHYLDTDPLKTTFECIIGSSVMSSMNQLPMSICFECAGLVRKFSLFKKRCLRGQSVLLGFLQKGVQLSQQVIQNIDRKELQLNSPCVTTNIETIEYNPLNDNYIESKENHNIKEEQILPLNCSIENSLSDNQSLKLDDALQDLTCSSDDELLTNKVKKKQLETTQKTKQEYLKILSEDFVENLMKSEPETLSKSSLICNRRQTHIRPSRACAKSLRTRAKSLGTCAKPPRTSAKPSKTSAKPPKTSVKPPKISVKPPKTSVKPTKNSVKTPKTSGKPPLTSVESLTSGAECPTSSAECPTSSAECPTSSTDPPTTSAESPSTNTKSPAASCKSPRTNVKSPKRSAKTAKSPRTSTKSSTTIKSPVTEDTGPGPTGVDDIDLVEYEIIDLTLRQQVEEIKKRKESDNYLHSPFKCEQCFRGFVDTTTFQNHSKKHDPGTGDIVCEICKFRFPTKRTFQKHTAYHEKKYACKGCSYVCTNITSAKLHQRWHKGVMYKCEICGKISSKQNSHLTHMRKLHPSQHICDICGYSFVSKQGVVQHKAIMHKDVMEKDVKDDQESGHSGSYCEECDVKFVSIEAYNRHMVTSSKHSINFIGGCKICGARFSSKEDLREHRRQRHPGQRNHFDGYTTRKKYHYLKKKPSRTWPGKCDHCPKEISNAREYWTHFRRAHPDLPYPIRKDYVCDICGKGFRGNAFLTYHKRTHSSERLFSCTNCGKSFYNRMNLVMHERTHSDAHPHPCKLCSKVFKFRSNLTRHYRIHNGDKPYECDICGKAFSQSNSRNVHIRTVHLKEPPPYMSKARLEKKKLSKKHNN